MTSQDNHTSTEESAVQAEELRVRRLEAEKALASAKAPWWRRGDPLIVAIIATALTLFGNMGVALLNNNASIAQEERKATDDKALETSKARYNLVLQAMATNDAAVAKRNIHFFIDAGLLEDPDCRIEDAIDKDSPVLPSLSGAIPALPSGLHSATEIANLYDFPTETDGRGQVIGLVELGGGFIQSDLDTYFAQLKLPVPDITVVPVDGGANAPGSIADTQVTADIEIVGAIAPRAKLRVYFSGARSDAMGYADIIRAAAADGVSVLSTGWGKPENNWSDEDVRILESALAQAARSKITVVAAAGDNGSSDGGADGRRHVDFPASSPWVLAVGATSLRSSDGRIGAETVWRSSSDNATGGGFSARFPLPDWQKGVTVPPGVGSPGRGVPDVVASADPALGYPIMVHGKTASVGGTSLAAPLWAGLIARLNQGLGQNVGYLSPFLYGGLGASGALHAITVGDNGTTGVPGFKAGPGWTPVTGWGSPDGAKIAEWLRVHMTGAIRHCGPPSETVATAQKPKFTLWGVISR